ncbi:MAG: EAL domain-containing protein [Curvibacter sp.]|nr:MAG: EAL domain-containing protein [Curvibacter sp.]
MTPMLRAQPDPTAPVATTAVRKGSLLAALLLVLLIGCVAALGGFLWKSRDDALDNARQTAEIHARNFEEHLTHTLQIVDFSAHGLNSPRPVEAITPRLLDLLRPSPSLRSLSVLDEQGRVIASTDAGNLGILVDLASYFPTAGLEAEVLRIGMPQIGRDLHSAGRLVAPQGIAPDAPTFVPVLKRLPGDPHKRWLLASLNPDYFLNHAAHLLPDPLGHVQWLRYDDVLLMSSSLGDRAGTHEAAGLVTSLLNTHEQGSLQQTLTDGQVVLTSYRASSRYPVVLAVHLRQSAVLAAWARQARQVLSVALPALLALLGAGGALVWRQRRLDHKTAELAEQRRLAASVFESSLDAIIITDAQARVLSANPAFERVTGYSAAEIVGQTPRLMASGLHDAAFYAALWHGVITEGRWQGEIINRHRSGRLYTALLRIHAVLDDAGQLCHYAGLITDISERKAAEERLQLAASVFTHANEAIMITTPEAELVEVNEAFERITGYQRAEVLGRNARLLNSGHQGPAFYTRLWESLLQEGRWTGEIWNRRKSGEVFVEMLTINAVRGPDGQVLRYVALFSDISTQKQHEMRLEHIAHYDALTGLPNRVLLSERLNAALPEARRQGQPLALVFLDLDGFKAVNDSYGHDKGDKLLQTLAERLQGALRNGDTLARLGGDEFVAVLVGLPREDDALPVLERLRASASAPVRIEGTDLEVSASLGVTFYPQVGEVDADQLLRQADQAMYQAKLAGRNRYQIFDAEHDSLMQDQHKALAAIHQGLQSDAFELFYQPKVHLRTGALGGMEALLRWRHPEQGLLLPGAFLQPLQGNPLLASVGEWVLDKALGQRERWKAQGLDIPISVNIDATHLQQADFMARLRATLARHSPLRPGDLELEILETSALDDIATVSRLMRECRDIGIGFALDDFGTGYASLTYLRRLPASLIKIDQSFVRNLLQDPEDRAILKGVLDLATAFRRKVVAEGVETLAHGMALLELGCEWGQGFAIAPPMPAQQVADWLARWRPDPRWAETACAVDEAIEA